MAVPIKGHKQGAQGAPDAQSTQPGQRSRRLSAIMFTDLVGYSAMAHRDEALAIELLEQHRVWVRTILPRYEGREIETIGDAFLIEFGSALAAVECAVMIQARFNEYNEHAPYTRRMQLRIGIHLGDVEHAGDKVMGDGVNIASRIHGMAQPGGICVSEDVQRAVRNRGGLRFASLGTPNLKNIDTPLELFEVHAGGGGRQAAVLSAVKRKARKIPRWLWVIVAIIAAINIFDDDNEIPDSKAPGKIEVDIGDVVAVDVGDREDAPSIAVLPFENLSSEADSAFFTDGLHDTVIGHLSRVKGLKVISRTSVMPYRGKQENLRRIGRKLGADHILEGSVQRAGGRVRVAAQLIETDTDTHVWSHEYDSELKDVFKVQADIAQSVAAAVHAKLTPQEQASIEAIPTQNTPAYDLYLRAVGVERRADAKDDEIREAIGWLEKAVALDPKFALAYALLAHLHDALYWSGYDPSDTRRTLVGRNADLALQLAPELAEAHVAKALFHYHGSRNYEAALAELEIARRLAPGNARVHFLFGPIYRRQGHWEEGLASLQRATELDPLNTGYLSELGGTLQMMRRYPEAAQAFAKFGVLEPESQVTPLIGAYHHFLATGDLTGVEQVLAKVPAGFDPGCQITGSRVGVAMLQRRFTEAIAAGARCKEAFVPASGGAQIPIEYFIAQVKWLAGNRKPPAEAEKARVILEKMLAERPDLADTRMHLASTLAMLGQRQRAIAEADRALADLPLSRDALTGAALRRSAVEVYANSGAEDRAIKELGEALELPNGGHAHEVRLDPMLDPLHGDPRFQKLVEKHLPKSGA
jgi:adenylate cyclase